MNTLSWKKALAAAIAAAITVFGNDLGLNEATIGSLITIILVFIGAQGVADFGKGRAQVEHNAYLKAKNEALRDELE